MSRASNSRRKFYQTILIVCEDTKVSPNYFHRIKEHVVQKGIWDNIDISPIPPFEEIISEQDKIPNKTYGKKRTLNKTAKDDELFEVEKEHKAIPVRYVREAQIKLEEGSYLEGWAVFDRDREREPYHIKAFELASKEPIVNIAFASIAFEHWLLLHFEKNNTKYSVASQIPLHKYISGYERNEKGKIDVYKYVSERTEIALENAAWLRVNSRITPPVYNLNPYQDIDKLIRQLFGIKFEFVWGTIGNIHVLEEIGFIVTKMQTGICINIENRRNTSLVTNEIEFSYKNNAIFSNLDSANIVVDPKQKKVVNFTFDTNNSLLIINHKQKKLIIEL